MKKLKLISAAFILAVVFNGCSNDDDKGNGLSCQDAVTATVAAATAFNAATNEEYPTLCASYRAALLAEIEACGDTNGELQAQIDELGNCMLLVTPDEN